MKPNTKIMRKKELWEYLNGRCRHGHTYAEHPNCWFTEQKAVRPKIGYLDIETSNLDANYGMIITYCILDDETDEIIEGTVNIKDVRKGDFDRHLCKQLIKDMQQFDIIKGYYSTKFDIPFMRSRSLKWKHNFPVYKSVNHKDVYYMAKRLLKLNSYRLEVVTKFLGIAGKDHVEGDAWMQALMCDGELQKKAMEYILNHNRKDVKILKEADYMLQDFDRGIVKSI